MFGRDEKVSSSRLTAVQYIILDDGSDTGKAVQNTRKLIDEDHVDAIVGSTVTPNSLAMLVEYAGVAKSAAGRPQATRDAIAIKRADRHANRRQGLERRGGSRDGDIVMG